MALVDEFRADKRGREDGEIGEEWRVRFFETELQRVGIEGFDRTLATNLRAP